MTLVSFLRDARWLGRRRLDAYARILLVIEIIGFVILVLGTHGLIVPLSKPTTTDFVSFYGAGLQADHGAAPGVYVRAQHYLAEEDAIGVKGTDYNYFFYPPVYILICQALTCLPYLPSFVVFQLLSGLAYLRAIRAILPVGRPLLPFIAYPAVVAAVGIGQNSLLSAALFGGGTLLVERRPWLAGVLFGALCYKPHLGLLIPVALLAGRHFRCFAAATATVAALVGLSYLLYGRATWDAFLTLSSSGTGGTFASGQVPFAGLISPYAALRLLGAGDHVALIAQAGIALAGAACVAVAWRSEAPMAVKSIVLIGATLLALPVLLFYDLTLAAVALAWCWRAAAGAGGMSRFLPWEKVVFAVAFLVPIISRGLGHACHIPVGPLAALGVLYIGLARLARYSSVQ